MSTSVRKGKYHCINGCQGYGRCPGHEMVVHFHRASDTVALFVDGKTRYVFDDNELDTFREILESGR